MATVFLATDLRLQRPVAVKVMHAELATDQQFVARFVRESRAAAALTHPNVVAVHDQGQDAVTGAVYIVMELIVGQTLRSVLAERGRLSVAQALAVIDPVLLALDAAHRAGFVHRDIKPENILISDEGQVKVTDFGLARALAATDSHASTRGMLIGTAAYLSPEQVEHGSADARSDIYSAGIVLFELLTGQTPHQAETPIALAFQHVHSDVPAPSTLAAEVPSALDAAVERATRRDPRSRYQSAAEFVADVRRLRPAVDGYTPAGDWRQTTVIAEQQPERRPEPRRPASEPRHTLVVDAAQPRRRRGRVALALLAVLVLAASGWAYWQSGRTSVPQLVGLSAAEAKAALARAELAWEISEQSSEEIAKGIVLAAEPTPGEGTSKGTAVTLTVSSGPRLIAVPSVTGLTEAAAAQALEQAELTVGEVTEDYSDTVASGQVVSSNPQPGEELRVGSPVSLILSKGPAPIKVPNVVGESEAGAKGELRAAGFSEFEVKFEFSETVAEGKVMATRPGAGKLKVPSTVIELTVSKGPPPVEVPSVLGLNESAAKQRLTAVGLRYRVEWENSCKPRKVVSTVVTAQDPARFTSVPKGTVVTLRMLKVCG